MGRPRKSRIVELNTPEEVKHAYLVEKTNLVISEPFVVSSEKNRYIYLLIGGTTNKYVKEDFKTKWFTSLPDARKYVRDECRRRYKEAKRQMERWEVVFNRSQEPIKKQ